MKITVVCVNHGNYLGRGEQYVRTLEAMVRRHLSQPFDFVCIEQAHGLAGWWVKVALFEPGRFEGRVVYFDLDSVIVGDLTELVSTKGIIDLSDWGWTTHTLCSGVMVWDAGEHAEVFTRFNAEVPGRFPGDQDWITHVGGWQALPAHLCRSYRYHSVTEPPAGCVHVGFHGKPKPHQVETGWVPAAWNPSPSQTKAPAGAAGDRMKKVDGWYFPDGESHLPQWMANPKVRMILNGRPAYQGQKQEAAMSYCTHFRRAVDVGGHVGLWSFNLAQRFADVHAFEPVLAHQQCFVRNVEQANVELHPCALGDRAGSVSIRTEPTSSGDSRVDGDGDIPMFTLDSFELADVDLIKIDCEGTELFVLRGAEATLARCKPVVIVEQKPGHAQKYGLGERDAIPFLQSLGYRLVREMAGDFILVAG